MAHSMSESTKPQLEGRALDAAVAEKVMGLKLDYEFADFLGGAPTVPALRDQYDEWGELPHYSTDILAAWEVVESLRQRGVFVDVYTSSVGFQAIAQRRKGGNVIAPQPSETAPLAICRAVLLCWKLHKSMAAAGVNAAIPARQHIWITRPAQGGAFGCVRCNRITEAPDESECPG